MSAIRTFNVEAGLPTLDEARRLVIDEIKRAKREGVKVLIAPHLCLMNRSRECGALARIFCEEVMVTARYPEYRQYAAKTWRMVPYVF